MIAGAGCVVVIQLSDSSEFNYYSKIHQKLWAVSIPAHN